MERRPTSPEPRRALLALLVLAAVFGAAACGGNEPRAQTLTQEDVATGALFAQARGHHLVALELYRSGDHERALVHAGHPVAELLPTLETETAEHDRAAASALKQALEAAQASVRERRPADAVGASVDAAATALDRAERAVVGDDATTARYRGSVIAALLGVAAGEYEEAVTGGTVSEILEYQDAYGFSRIAKNIYEGIEDGVKSANAEEAAEIEEAFETLAKALPSPKPPTKPMSHEGVERATGLIAHELEETVNALVAETAKPEEIFDRIDALLTQVVDEYDKGEKDEAAELVAKAYLENYELIEADVIRLAKDVNAELEPLLGSQLRARIKAGGSMREIAALVARARELLAKARTAVEAAG